ncbi:Z1 domain-containing protein [Modestobacter sp. VKM Ac-2978]|uniref:Z1 domain-containing protein n=1 Tax=Modestobacter sp. VKM Ac-2978 TaxID=3004132 RepID=UPI0022AA1A70|nr:Z1 domain-containing protein [Modestobacter sp. VKM Ac-2978]MCZ2849129.1 Z1 domain-containing protein [Modestobacter sp. VKM Ac-2978]
MSLIDAYRAALLSLGEGAPKPLERRAQLIAEEEDPQADVSLSRLVDYLSAADVNDSLRIQLHVAILRWDSADTAAWAPGTTPYTRERRNETYSRLQLDAPSVSAFEDVFPIATAGGSVISNQFEDWYTPERRQERRHYWNVYSSYLLEVRGWGPEAVVRLDTASSQVVERLSDPTRPQAYQAKGLVVGYVQSGKTANFTGVIAKAIDAGYRLVIVLTGTVDLLRQQTQRRLDMELVGVENIQRGVDLTDPDMAGRVDYQEDNDWIEGKFVKHGYQPSLVGAADIVRLTTSRNDYRRLNTGIVALDVARTEKQKPLYDPVNLFASDARLAVIKKNATVLTKLVQDLKSITANLSDIPVLIIDDESDQASVNTSNPARWQAGQTDRTKINKLISDILGLLPRAQYVGYTATPFANVFIDPGDSEDIFPKDFLISLERPVGYMGVSDFHDIDSDVEPADRTPANSQEAAFVRPVHGQTDDERQDDLTAAIDSYVLAGALKLYREARLGQPRRFRHHTMLVHESVKMQEHRDTRDNVIAAWRGRGYASAKGLAVLRTLYESDFRRVSDERAGGLPYPVEFDELEPFVGQAIAKMVGAGGDPVLIVNGDQDLLQEALDFDAHDVWRILVGGTKLSRGFTVEGLTTSYYRRRTGAADTLMQMGRWFGFREGYSDLVRLYIGRRERIGQTFDDLYAKFEAIVRDEEAFREQLRQYAKPVDGEPQIRPDQIPPLVSQHLPTLRPTALNKMYNAELQVRRSPGTPLEPTAYPDKPVRVKANYDAAVPLLQSASTPCTLLVPSPDLSYAPSPSSFTALTGVVPHEQVLDVLRDFAWLRSDYFSPDLRYLEEITGQLDDWVLLAPQLALGASATLPDVGSRSLFRRERRRAPMFGAISEPRHRRAGIVVATRGGGTDPVARQLAQQRRGVLLLYPVIEPGYTPQGQVDPSRLVVAFTAITPQSAIGRTRQLVTFRARNSALTQPIIDAEDDDDGI